MPADRDAPGHTALEELLRARSLEQIRGAFGDDLPALAEVFLADLGRGASPFEQVRTWERWLPLVREEAFVRALERVVAELEPGAPSEGVRQHLRVIAATARQMSAAPEEELRRYFEDRADPERLHASVAEEGAEAEYRTALGAARRGDLVGARIHSLRAIDAAARLGDARLKALATLSLANCHWRAGDTPGAVRGYESAAEGFRALGDPTNLALTLYNLGRALLESRQPERAYQHGRRGLEAIAWDEPRAAEVARDCASLMLEATSRFSPAEQLDRHRQLVALLEGKGLQELQACAHMLMADAFSALERFEEGYEAATRAVERMVAAGASPDRVHLALGCHHRMWNATGRPPDGWLPVAEVLTHTTTPAPQVRLGELLRPLASAIAAGRLDLDAARRALREEHARLALDPQAVTALQQGLEGLDLETAAPESLSGPSTYVLLLREAAELSGADGAAGALRFHLGRIHDRLGRLPEAAEEFEAGAALARRSGNVEFSISMAINAAIARRRGGDLSRALQGLEALSRDPDLSRAAHRLPEVELEAARCHLARADPGKAAEVAVEGLRLVAGLSAPSAEAAERLRRTEAELNTIVGLACKRREQYGAAARSFQIGLEAYRELQDRRMEAYAFGNLAAVQLDVGDLAEGLRAVQSAHQLLGDDPVTPASSFVHTTRAILLSMADRPAEARSEAAAVLKAAPPPEQAAQCVCVLLDTATSAPERLEARREAERLLAARPSPELESALLSHLIAQDDVPPEQAGEWRARLRDTSGSCTGLQGAYLHLRRAELHGDSPAGRRAAIGDLERTLAIIDALAAGDPGRDVRRSLFATAARAAERLLVLRSDDDRYCLETLLRTKARATFGAGLAAPQDLEQLRRQLARLPQPVLLVEMYLLPAESVLFFVGAGGLLGVERLPITAAVLAAEGGLVARLGDPRRHEEAWRSETWRLVSRQFAGAVARYLQPGQLVCLVPAGFWHYLPLHACVLDGRPLIEDHPVVYGPSSAILSRPGDPGRRWSRCLSVGVEFEREAEWVAERFGAKAVLGADAVPGAVEMVMQDADLVHFSCHGAHNPLRGSESGLVLAHGGWLTPASIEQGRTSADLVTLSACETAFDFVSAGNDTVGLDQAFLDMGAVSVMGTLWRVESESAECLVRSFYGNLSGAGDGVKRMTKVEALRRAAATVRADGRFDHPYYWAPFKLIGGWI